MLYSIEQVYGFGGEFYHGPRDELLLSLSEVLCVLA